MGEREFSAAPNRPPKIPKDIRDTRQILDTSNTSQQPIPEPVPAETDLGLPRHRGAAADALKDEMFGKIGDIKKKPAPGDLGFGRSPESIKPAEPDKNSPTWLNDLDTANQDDVRLVAEKLLARALTNNNGRLADIPKPEYDKLVAGMERAIVHQKNSPSDNPQEFLTLVANRAIEQALGNKTEVTEAGDRAAELAMQQEVFEGKDNQAISATLLDYNNSNWKNTVLESNIPQIIKELGVEVSRAKNITPGAPQHIKDKIFARLIQSTKIILNKYKK